MEKNAKGNRETLPNPLLVLKPAAEACHKLQASGNMATTWKYFTGLLTDTSNLLMLQWCA